MLTWLAPRWLAAAAALALPIVIHLLSRGRVRRVAVGSVRLLRASAISERRTLRFHHPLLFAIRCLLLLLLAVGLAAPRAHQPLTAGPPNPWVLVEEELLARRASIEPREPELFRRLDAALAAGGELHPLATGRPPRDLWSLLREASIEAPPRTRFEIFALDRLGTLAGERPTLPRPVEWASTGVEQEPVPSAARGAGREIRVLVAASGERAEDAVYVVSALEAAAADSGRRIAVRRARPTEVVAEVEAEVAANGAPGGGRPADGLDLLFWLTAEPVPDRVRTALGSRGLLISDAVGDWQWLGSEFRLPLSRGSGGNEAIRLDRWNGSPPWRGERGAPLWVEASGRSLLEVVPQAETTWLHFHARFHAAWTGLVLDPAFVHWAEELLSRGALVARGPAPWIGAVDPRAAGAGVGRPRGTSDGGSEVTAPPLYAWPEKFAWALLAGLFAVERWLALRAGQRRAA